MAVHSPKARVHIAPACQKLYAAILIKPGERPEVVRIGERKFMLRFRDGWNADSDLLGGMHVVLRRVAWKLATPFHAKGGAS